MPSIRIANSQKVHLKIFRLPMDYVLIGLVGELLFLFFRAILPNTSNYNGFEVLITDSILLIIFVFWWLIIRVGGDTYRYPSSKNCPHCRLLKKNTDGGIWLN